MELLIRNGYVYDPINGVRGEVMDIAIKDGKIVEDSEINLRKAKVIDASHKVVMPGGVDIHSHIAGPKVNVGRMMMVSDHYRSFMRAKPPIRRSGTGKYTPSTYLTGYRYARMGWTMAVEPASPPLKTRHTHEELNSIPILDKAVLVLVDSNRLLLRYLSGGDLDRCKEFLKWLLAATKAYGVKLVDPGSAVLWSLGREGPSIDDVIEPYGITPREIVRGLCRVVSDLKLPHAVHVHCNRLGVPGGYADAIETVKTAPPSDSVNLHLAHLQFNSYAGDDWSSMESGAEEVAKLLNSRSNVSLDIGQIDFGTAITMTADAPFEFALYHIARWKWAGADVEAEAASGIVPYKYKKRNYVNALQWCIGLELALLVRDPWRVVLSTDHPNGAPFTRYPKIIALLMSRRFREKVMEKLNRAALKRSALPSINREYDLYDVTIITRAAPAKLLGLDAFKGHLGVGADGDVAIYDIDPERVDPSRDFERIVRAFKRAKYTIKDGTVVVKNGEVVRAALGRTFYVSFDGRPGEGLEGEIREFFRKWYSVELENYVIGEDELRRPYPIRCGAAG